MKFYHKNLDRTVLASHWEDKILKLFHSARLRAGDWTYLKKPGVPGKPLVTFGRSTGWTAAAVPHRFIDRQASQMKNCEANFSIARHYIILRQRVTGYCCSGRPVWLQAGSNLRWLHQMPVAWRRLSHGCCPIVLGLPRGHYLKRVNKWTSELRT